MTAELDVQLLMRIHSLLRQKADLNERLEKGPRVIKASEQNVSNFEIRVAGIKERIKEAKMKADGKQLQLGERESHIEKLESQRNACNTNREFQLLNDQIAADKQANGVLQDEILELLEKIDTLEDELATGKVDLEKLTIDSQRIQSETQSKIDSLNRDLDDVEQDLTEAESKLPFEVRSEYKRLVGAVGEDALSHVENKTCGHCMKLINTQTFSELTMSRVIFCGGCGSLMYLQKATATT